MAQEDYALTALLNRLGANNIGAISDTDVRSIVEYARPHVLQASDENVSTAGLTTYNTSTITAYQLLSSSPDVTSSGYLSAVAGPPHAVEYSETGSHPARLFRVEWDFWGYPAAEYSWQLTFYKDLQTDVWPADVERLRSSRINTYEIGELESSPGSPVYRVGTTGSLITQLADGDRIVPLLEVNVDNSASAITPFSYVISVTSLGPVEDALTIQPTGDADVDFISTIDPGPTWVDRDTAIPS